MLTKHLRPAFVATLKIQQGVSRDTVLFFRKRRKKKKIIEAQNDGANNGDNNWDRKRPPG
jgi:hypothetical protein